MFLFVYTHDEAEILQWRRYFSLFILHSLILHSSFRFQRSVLYIQPTCWWCSEAATTEVKAFTIYGFTIYDLGRLWGVDAGGIELLDEVEFVPLLGGLVCELGAFRHVKRGEDVLGLCGEGVVGEGGRCLGQEDDAA